MQAGVLKKLCLTFSLILNDLLVLGGHAGFSPLLVSYFSRHGVPVKAV